MKITFNWGSGIFIFILIFFIAAFAFIYFSFLQKSDLVEKNYYPKEITYQKQIEKANNYSDLGEEIFLQKAEDMLVLTFPGSHKTPINGEIHIYRPSDEDLDKKLEILSDNNNQQFIPIDQLEAGKYILKVDWFCDSIGYYHEIIVVI